MENPLVSIIMPVYNCEDTVGVAIASIVQQTYSNWELIIVNDGSNDMTDAVLASISDIRVKVIRQSNHGRGYARNVALQQCKGEYITFLDGDDFANKERIEKQVMFLERNRDINLVSTAMMMFGKENRFYRTKKIDGVIDDFADVNCATAMIRRRGDSDICYNTNLNCGEDVDFLTRYVGCGKMYALDEVLYYYNICDMSKKKMIKYSYYMLKNDHGDNLVKIFLNLISFSLHLLYYLMFPLKYICLRRYPSEPTKDDILDFVAHKRRLGVL